MIVKQIPIDQIRFFSPLMSDYVGENRKLSSLYNHFPTLSNFRRQIDQKKTHFSEQSRNCLVEVVKQQYSGLQTCEKVWQNIENLRHSNTFTITTGHQLSLFTGHLYFIYKIISVINTTKILRKQYPDYQFVPVYWMATEDHDFEEINHFHFHNKTICWNSSQTGMTGDFNTQTLDNVFKFFDNSIGIGEYASQLKRLFTDSYLKNKDLASATRFLVNALFQEYGLVVIDANHTELKRQFIPFMKEDLMQHTAFQRVTETISEIQHIDKAYPIQVNPREINLFYVTQHNRNRIIKTEKGYQIHQTDISFSQEEIIREMEKYPERFSPNVILRPLYQEVILPNLAYIGGGGEIAYWLEEKRFFESQQVPFPILMLRNSVMLITEKQRLKMQKLQLSEEDLFLKSEDLKNKKTRQMSDFVIDFTAQKDFLQQQFTALYRLAEKTDSSFVNAVKAQETKQLKGLDKLEKRLLKAQKRKFADELQRILALQNELFPNGSLQERFSNFSEFYLIQGKNLIPNLVENLNPFDSRFSIIKI